MQVSAFSPFYWYIYQIQKCLLEKKSYPKWTNINFDCKQVIYHITLWRKWLKDWSSYWDNTIDQCNFSTLNNQSSYDLVCEFDIWLFSVCIFFAEGNKTYCLPYFYLIGMGKCGTTDLHGKLSKHQSILYGNRKEIQWWPDEKGCK